MATKKIFRLDLFIEWYRDYLSRTPFMCSPNSCPVHDFCIVKVGDDYRSEVVCVIDKKEDFKQAIIDRFSTDVEVEQ